MVACLPISGIQESGCPGGSRFTFLIGDIALSDHHFMHASHHDVAASCRFYGKRLPTEQEQEYAARGTHLSSIFNAW